ESQTQSQQQLHSLQAERDRLQTRLQESQAQSQQQLHSLQAERNRLQTQLQESQTQSQQQLHSLQAERDQLQLQLHETQEEVEIFFLELKQIEAEFAKLKLQRNIEANINSNQFTHYYLLVFDAWSAFYNGQKEKMIHYLQLSLRYASFSKTEAILDWLKWFNKLSMEQKKSFNTKSLINSPEWQNLVQRVILNQSMI
ncbi:MAG: hypothetical protein RI580_05670, partial [Halothece sp. Uz-M2-17]|nr:hypothetical protein [Halothece sp. Uz-M2-17]